MAKTAKTTCDRCESRITVGAPFCGPCGYPTPWASHDERTAWEVAHYREKAVTAPINTIAEDAPRTRAAARVDVIDRPAVKREKRTLGSLFGRRRPEPRTITLPEPKRVEPPVEAPSQTPKLTMVRMAAEGIEPPVQQSIAAATATAPKAVPAVAPRPAPRVRSARPVAKPAAPKADGLVSKVERAMDDNEMLIDTPATVLAMRLLNQRVRELDEKVQRLERELTAAKATPAPGPEPEKPHKRFGR